MLQAPEGPDQTTATGGESVATKDGHATLCPSYTDSVDIPAKAGMKLFDLTLQAPEGSRVKAPSVKP